MIWWSVLCCKMLHICVCVSASPPNPTVLLFQDQQEVMEVTEGKSVTLSCSIKIFCPSLPSSLTWSSTLQHLNITEYKNDTHLYSDLMFTVTHHHHRAEFTCTATHYFQEKKNTTHSTRLLHVQCKTQFTSVTDDLYTLLPITM